jgi:hypothetical protein
VTDDGSDLEPSPHPLRKVHGHLDGIAGRHEVLEKRGGEVLGEGALVAETPEVELHGLRLQEAPLRAVRQLQVVEVRLARHGADRGELVRRELHDGVLAAVGPGDRVDLTRPYRTPDVAPEYPLFSLHV